MSAVLNIISHEYRKYVFTKGFIAFLFLIPFAMAIGFGAAILREATESAKTFHIIDRAGGYEEVLRTAVDTDREDRIISNWDNFVSGLSATGLIDENALEEPFRPADRTRARRQAFFEAGGIEAGSDRLRALTDTEIPPFEEPRLRYRVVDLDLDLPDGASTDVIGAAYAPYMRGDKELPGEDGRLTGVIFIPEDFSAEGGSEVVYLTDNLNDDSIASFVRSALSDDIQKKAYIDRGLSEDDIIRIDGLRATVRSVKAGTEVQDEAQRRRDRIETLLPFGLAYILFFGAFSVGSMLLTNTIEEKSNKIVEMLLSSVSAWQLMIGKLIALALVGMTPLVFFGAVGVGLLTFFGAGDEFFVLVRDVLVGSPLVPFFFLYFLLGYLLVGAVYLGIGALCETIQDAQNLSTPLTFVILLPTITMVQPIIEDPNGIIARVLTWIPLYSHVVMMLRLSSNPPMWEIAGGTIVLAGAALLLVGFMGRIYKAGILQSGGKATFKGMLEAARASSADAAR